MEGLIVHAGAQRIGRQDLLALPTPEATATHVPIAHAALVAAILEALAYRQLEVYSDEYAVTPDGMRLFGFLVLTLEEHGIRLAIGLRNSHDKSFSLGLVSGYRVMVCDNMAFHGSFAALARKHTKHVDLVEVVAAGVDRVQRHFQKIRADVNVWRGYELADQAAKAIMFDAFVAGNLDAPKHLGSVVAQHYFEPQHDEFKPRTMWSLSNAFTSGFKVLDAIPQMRATAALPAFLASYS